MRMKDQFGNITLHNADCMDILRDMADNSFDLAIVDPPYFDGPNKLGYYGLPNPRRASNDHSMR